jgi:hypothetical protein
MGLLVINYTTSEGFLVPQLYIQLQCVRMLKTLNGDCYGMSYGSLAYKSLADKDSGASPIGIPMYLATVDDFQSAESFYNQTIFGFAYGSIKKAWESAGYVVEDYYPHPPTPTTYIYDCSGYNFKGFNCAGYDREGYDADGFNAQGWDREGYNREGYDVDGYNRQGFDREGYDREGYDYYGCNRSHVDRQGNPCPATQ